MVGFGRIEIEELVELDGRQVSAVDAKGCEFDILFDHPLKSESHDFESVTFGAEFWMET